MGDTLGEALDVLMPIYQRFRPVDFSASRRMLAVDRDIACGFTTEPGKFPSPYACAKGLWCAFPPLFARDKRLYLNNVTWQSSWVDNTRCPEMDSYKSAYLFLFRAFMSLGRDQVDRSRDAMWPWAEFTQTVWEAATFPNGGRWPAAERHRPPHDVTATWVCVSMNIGVLVAPLIVAVVAFAVAPVLATFSAEVAETLGILGRPPSVVDVELVDRANRRGRELNLVRYADAGHATPDEPTDDTRA